MTVTAVEDEYWSYQYVTGDRLRNQHRWWPDEGVNRLATQDDAERAVKRYLDGHGLYRADARVIHVTRRVEYGPTQTNLHDDTAGGA